MDDPNLAGGRSANVAACSEGSIMLVVTTLRFGRPLTVEDMEQLPNVDVFERTGDGRLCTAGSTVGEAVLQCHAPFAVEVRPSALVADLEPR